MPVKDLKKADLDTLLTQIIDEKNKIEKITKKLHDKIPAKGKTQKAHKNDNKPIQNDTTDMQTMQTMQTLQVELNSEPDIKHQLQIKGEDFKNVSKETVNKILDLLKNYVNMDKSFRLKHESLKTLYTAYLELYKKYKDQPKQQNLITDATDAIDAIDAPNALPDNSKHTEMLKNIHSEMKDNSSNLYRERLIILKKIKDTPELDHQMKNKLCGRLIAVFKSPPIPEYKPIQLLKPSSDSDDDDEKISVNELDNAYLQKHNELLTVFKAYQNLYNKVLNYKEQLEKYKNLSTGSSISRCEMEKMLKDQRFVMDMIDKMQDKLVDNKVIDNSEKVLITPVASHPENMNAFNNTMRDQIKHIIDRNLDMNPNTKNKIENLLSQYKECDSNDKFCTSGKKLILLKKM